VVITGGAARLEGIAEVGEEIFGMPVRVGIPTGVTGLADMVAGPEYATAVGLNIFGLMDARQTAVRAGGERGAFRQFGRKVKGGWASFSEKANSIKRKKNFLLGGEMGLAEAKSWYELVTTADECNPNCIKSSASGGAAAMRSTA
jgi:cell division ATPase FtsA